MEHKCVHSMQWGGLVDTLREDCSSVNELDAKTAELLQRLDQLAACTSLMEIAAFFQSTRSFTTRERDYLMSPLLDEIYWSMVGRSLDGIHFGPRTVRSCLPDEGNLNPERFKSAVFLACVHGLDRVLSFFLDRGASDWMSSNICLDQRRKQCHRELLADAAHQRRKDSELKASHLPSSQPQASVWLSLIHI